MNAKRKQIPKEVETAVLTKSRRRCCLCFFWEQNLAQQDGQIAHIDRDPSNAAEDNLAWLCFRHHNQYDSRQSQGKNITPDELRHARDQLYAALALGAGLPTPPKPPTAGLPLPVLYRAANLPPRNPDFVGRENLKARVREFISRPQAGGYLVLIAGMGRGKTAFLTELVHEEIEAGHERICHFIDYHPSTTGEGDTIVRSLLDQLRAKYPDLKTPEAWQTRPPDLPAQLEWTLRELSDHHHWGRDGVPPEVIYIDAADQAEADERRPLLFGFLRHLPPGVACVITTRPDRRWLRTRRGVTVWCLDLTTEAEMAAVPDEAYQTDDELADLMGEDAAEETPARAESLIDDRADVRRYLEEQLPARLQDKSPAAIGELIGRIVSQEAPPVFFTVKSCLDRLADPKERRSLLVKPARWCAAPESLVEEEAIHAVDRARAAGVEPTDFWDQLGLAALARETLCEATWRGLGLWRDEVTPHVLAAAANFFRPRPDVPDPTAPIEFDHPGYVREVQRHLARRDAELQGRLADACARWQQLQPPARDYALRHAAEHLQAAKRQTQLRELLLRYDWLDARLEQDGVWPVLVDYALCAADDAIRRVTEALRRSIETLAADPQQLPTQLLGRLGGDEQLAALLEAAARDVRRPWLRPLTPTLTPPEDPLLWTLRGHAWYVLSVVVTPDGRRAISASGDRTLKVWDLALGRLQRTFTGHADRVISVAVTADGRRAISASLDGTLKVWDVGSGQLERTLIVHTWGFWSVAVTPDDRCAVSASCDGTLNVWDLGSGQLERTLNVWDLPKSRLGRPLDPRAREDWTDWSVALTPDGQHAISASADGTLTVWDVGSGQLERTLKGHTYRVRSIAVTPDSQHAISASADRTLKVWDVGSGQLERTLIGHTRSVQSVAVTPDGQRAISASWDCTLKVWNLATGQLECTLEGDTAGSQLSDSFDDWLLGWRRDEDLGDFSVCVTRDGQRAISTLKDRTLGVWDLASGQLELTLESPTAGLRLVTATPDGRLVISTSTDHTLKVWDLANCQLDWRLKGDTNWFCSVTVTPDGEHAISTSKDRTLKVWDLPSGRLNRTLEGHPKWVRSMAVTPDSQNVISASEDRTLKVWDLGRSQLLRTLKGHTAGVSSVAVTRDGQRVVSASKDCTLRVWDLASGRLERTLHGHAKWVLSVAVTPDGQRAVSASSDRKLKVWDLANGQLERTLQGHTAGVKSVAVMPDGQHAISASWDCTLKVWNLATGRLEQTLEGHGKGVWAVAVTADGSRAFSASEDCTLKVWDLASGTCVASLVSDWPMASCTVAPDGHTFVAGDKRGRVHFLRLVEAKDASHEGESMTEHVFLSYCRENDAAVRQLYDELTAAGHAVWRDQERLLPGMDWKHEIRRAIRRAYAVVICFSQEIAARHRSGIYPEALLAIEEYRQMPPGSIYLIPVRLSACEIPPIELTPTRTLQDLHYEDLFPRDHRPAALKRLLQSLAAAKRDRR